MMNLRLVARRSVLRPTTLNASRASLSMSARRSAGKEDKLHTEGRAEEIEEHKQESLKKQREGKGEWKDEIASSSESIIKAERGEVEASEETIKKLQEESKKV